LALAVGVHEFFELGGGLDLEEDLLAVLSGVGITWLFTFRFSCSPVGTLAACSVIASSSNSISN
jgi:hypothetical protein